MKKVVIAFFLVLGVIFTVSGQEGPIDLVLLLDTSSSMSASYRELNDYMTGKFLRDYLRTGDTFHLIPFSGRPRVDISRRIEGRGDVETIIGRMLLQYPLEPWSDIAAALSFAETYVSTLPSRPKKIVLLTDGDSSPQPGSSSPALDAAGLESLIGSAKDRLNRQGVSLEYVRVSPGAAAPLANLPASGRAPMRPGPVPSGSAAGRTEAPAGTGSRPAAQPGGLPPSGPARPVEPAPAAVPRGPGQPPAGQAQAGQSAGPPPDAAGGPAPGAAQEPFFPASPPGGSSPGAPSAGTVPEDFPPAAFPGDSGESGLTYPASPFPEETGPEGETFSEPSSGEIPADSASPAPGPARPAVPARYNQDSFSLPLIIGLVILGLAALGLIIFLVTRQLQGSPNRAISQAASRPAPEDSAAGQFTDHSAALASYAANQRPRTGPYSHRYTPQNIDDYQGPLMLNLFVEDQNTFIGKRNIHALKSGHVFTVGGGNSDFLIFLVSVPPHIGEVRCDGNRCTFIPRKPQYFPDIGSQQVPDCIGKTIRIISDKNYELHFRLERYEDPLKALNRLLNSVQVPG
jgi:hypothetical protein